MKEYYGDKGFLYKLAHISDNITLFFASITKMLLLSFNFVLNFMQKKWDVWDNNLNWKRARYFTFPFHFFWIWIWKRMQKKDVNLDLIDATEGLQVISGNTGSGKSTLAFDVIEKDRIFNEKPWYVNTDFEKPRYDPLYEAKVRYHTFIPFEEVWSKWKMHVRLNQYLYGGYIIDEIHRIFDYRRNTSNDYMAKFTPFRDYALVSRKHIKKLIGITQMDKLDIQLMHLVKLWHKPRVDIGFHYEDWMVETGLFRFKIKGWWIDTYRVDTSSATNMLVPVKSWYRKATADFEYFDTYAYSDAYDHIPLHNGEGVKNGISK